MTAGHSLKLGYLGFLVLMFGIVGEGAAVMMTKGVVEGSEGAN